jgi:hypothetical protein
MAYNQKGVWAFYEMSPLQASTEMPAASQLGLLLYLFPVATVLPIPIPVPYPLPIPVPYPLPIPVLCLLPIPVLYPLLLPARYLLPIPVLYLLPLPAWYLLPSPVHGDENDAIAVNESTMDDAADVATADDESHDTAANCLEHHHDDDFHEYAHDVDAKHAGTASLLLPATGPPCLLDPCSSLHLPFDRLHPLPPLLSALCTLPSVSAGGEGSCSYGEGLSICGLASCPLVSGEGLNLYAHCAEMSQVIH